MKAPLFQKNRSPFILTLVGLAVIIGFQNCRPTGSNEMSGNGGPYPGTNPPISGFFHYISPTHDCGEISVASENGPSVFLVSGESLFLNPENGTSAERHLCPEQLSLVSEQGLSHLESEHYWTNFPQTDLDVRWYNPKFITRKGKIFMKSLSAAVPKGDVIHIDYICHSVADPESNAGVEFDVVIFTSEITPTLQIEIYGAYLNAGAESHVFKLGPIPVDQALVPNGEIERSLIVSGSGFHLLTVNWPGEGQVFDGIVDFLAPNKKMYSSSVQCLPQPD